MTAKETGTKDGPPRKIAVRKEPLKDLAVRNARKVKAGGGGGGTGKLNTCVNCDFRRSALRSAGKEDRLLHATTGSAPEQAGGVPL